MNYSHHDADFDEDDIPTMIGILLGIVLVWWGVVHLVDKFTLDYLPWWAEPFTIIPVFVYIVMLEKYETPNPLHWWPLVWGYKIKMPANDVVRAGDVLVKQYGGRGNVFVPDCNYIKFRRKKDAVNYCLFNL